MAICGTHGYISPVLLRRRAIGDCEAIWLSQRLLHKRCYELQQGDAPWSIHNCLRTYGRCNLGQNRFRYLPPWNLPNTDIWKSGICNPTGLEIRFNEVALQYKQTPNECFAVRIGDAQDFEKNFINRTFQDLRVTYAELTTHLDLDYMAHRIEHLNQKGVRLTQGKLIDGYTEMLRFTPST